MVWTFATSVDLQVMIDLDIAKTVELLVFVELKMIVTNNILRRFVYIPISS